MAINNFKPFATAVNANVTSQADWESLPALLSGFMAGKASSAQVNKAIRQASFIAAALAQYTANKSGLDVLDDGDLNGFISKMGTAFGKDFQALDATLTALAGLATGANKLPYFTGNDTAAQTDLTSVGRDIIGKNTIADILTYLGINETINPSKRVSIGALGTGVFDGSKPAINIGDSDSGFVFESDGVIGVYANSQKIAELTNTEYKIIGNLSLTNGALLLGGLTHFIRHTDADDAGFAGNNVEIGSWNGIGLTCTYDGTTRIYFNTRTGEVGLKGPLKADGNVYSGDAWLDQTGNVQGSLWGSGVGLKGYLDNTFNKKNTASLDTNGWHRDESTGLITQWGLIDGANGTYNFPRGFPNQCFAVLVTNTSTQGSGVDNAFGYPISNNQFIAGSKNDGGGISPYPVAFLAFGR
ncbi:TPA: gp53-like domain-containing protein [Salmonella enterica subsp. enterica]